MDSINKNQIPDNNILKKHYFSSLIVYGFAIIFINFNPFITRRFNLELTLIFNLAYITYAIITPFLLYIFKPKSVFYSHNIVIYGYLKRIFSYHPRICFLKSNIEEIKNTFAFYKPNEEESQALMLIFIKIFFGSLMVSFFTSNLDIIINRLPEYKILFSQLFVTDINQFIKVICQNKEFLYINSILLLFTIDIICFLIGYFTELDILKNRINFVETTPLGICVCLACYPPFNSIVNTFTGWNQSDNAVAFGNIDHPLTWTFRLIALFFLVIYVSASVALGTKASNLTNRGTVSRFPYNIVRHPAYISKNLFWFFTTIPMFFGSFNLLKFVLVMISYGIWFTIYYFRALTEERLMIKDSKYKEYMEKVKYRFIPYIF